MKPVLLFTLIVAFLATSCELLDPNEEGNLVAKTVAEDLSLPSVQLSSTKLHVQTYGSPQKTKIFMLEGGTGEDFRYLLVLNNPVKGWSLPQQYQVIYHDYRGCGLSQRHPSKELTIALSLKDLEELIDKYAPNEKIILIGHSHGGFVAAQYLNSHPDRVKGAVFIEGGAFSTAINKKLPKVNSVNYFGMDINQILWVKQLIGMDNHTKADYLYDIGRINRNNADRGQNCPSPNYRAGAASAIAIAIGEVYDGNYDFTTKLSTFQPQVLFISSDQSKDLGFDFQERYQASLFPNYIHKKIVGTGHTGIITCRTEETLGYIKEYLEGIR
ncbi:MAG: alpha/beta hydrolase [Haliscomenobacter sp.]|uniref:alpha/beta hydrolase n=1 Tax=Haliscomenobacter sp. TaxID=2717303 RepID=UPI0029BE4225|nr:alpha/beta hydrolase [Haliscomenobacter sp.]MDX2068637.1 alpha/beta hydrolase [Haliscomenobacter sp.]